MQILRPPARITGGSILFQDEDVTAMSADRLRRYRWSDVSMVFQSAMNALNPVMRVEDQFLDMMRAHRRVSKREALARAGELLELVGIERRRLRAYPHELSGGMRQRVIIGMALALQPELVILDEPTTALDVVVQREILQQVQEIQRQLGFSVLFITHDLSLLLEVAHRIAIMYAGEIVESATAEQLAKQPRHPYTQGLLQSFPPLHGQLTRLTGIPGSPPDLSNPPAGCRFHPRCPFCDPANAGLFARQTTERPPARARRARPRGRVPPRLRRRCMSSTVECPRARQALFRSAASEAGPMSTQWTTSPLSFVPGRSPRSWARAAAGRRPSRA